MTNIHKYMLMAGAIAITLVVFFPGYGILAKTLATTDQPLSRSLAAAEEYDADSDCGGTGSGPGAGLATGQPGINYYPSTAAGKSTPLPKPYPGAPALIPHSIEGFKITRDVNNCIGCHAAGVELSPGHVATKIPTTHYDGDETEVAGRRFNCLQCHVIQVIEEPPMACPSLTMMLSKTKVYWASYADYTNRTLSVDYSIGNTGTTGAYDARIVGTVNNGGVTSTNTPLPIGVIAAGASAGATVKYHVPVGVRSFTSTVYLTTSDASGNSYQHPGPYPGA